jgi:hypothetical protein
LTCSRRVHDADTSYDESKLPDLSLRSAPDSGHQLRNAVEAGSDDDGWASLASVGHILTQQSPDVDSRNYCYAKLSDLMAATTLFELDRRSPGDGKPEIIYAHDKRRRPARKSKPASADS